MTSTLLMLGASLIDAGNVSHASDGRVLGEHIAAELGADPDDSQLISVRSDDEPDNSAVHNYAHGGALSGRGPTQILMDAACPSVSGNKWKPCNVGPTPTNNALMWML